MTWKKIAQFFVVLAILACVLWLSFKCIKPCCHRCLVPKTLTLFCCWAIPLKEHSSHNRRAACLHHPPGQLMSPALDRRRAIPVPLRPARRDQSRCPRRGKKRRTKQSPKRHPYARPPRLVVRGRHPGPLREPPSPRRREVLNLDLLPRSPSRRVSPAGPGQDRRPRGRSK